MTSSSWSMRLAIRAATAGDFAGCRAGPGRPRTHPITCLYRSPAIRSGRPGDPVPVVEHLQNTGNAIRFGNRVWPSSCPLTGAPNQEPLEQAGHRGSIPHPITAPPTGAPTGRPSRSAGRSTRPVPSAWSIAGADRQTLTIRHVSAKRHGETCAHPVRDRFRRHALSRRPRLSSNGRWITPARRSALGLVCWRRRGLGDDVGVVDDADEASPIENGQ